MWKRLCDLNFEIVNHQTIKIDDFLYIIGGYKHAAGQNYEKISIYLISRDQRCIRVDVDTTIVWDCASGFVQNEENNVNPIDRYGHSMIVWKQIGVLFGGCSNYDYCDPDIYLFTSKKKCSSLIRNLQNFDHKRERWVKVSGIGGSIPVKRDGHSAVLHEDSMFVFGGLVENEIRHYDNKLYQLDFKSWQWTIVYRGNYLEPLGRDFCQLIAHTDCLYLIGGRSDSCYNRYTRCDVYDTAVWKFDLHPRIQEKNWKCIHPGHGIICESIIENTRYQTETNNRIRTLCPQPRRSFMSVILKNEIILFGGLYETSEINVHFNDLWSFDIIQNNWRCLSYTVSNESTKPVPLRRGSLTIINNNCALLIGGMTAPNNSNIDTTKIMCKSLKFPVNLKPREFDFVEGENIVASANNCHRTSISNYHLFNSPFFGSIDSINEQSLKSTYQMFLFQRNITLYQKALNIVVRSYSLNELKRYQIPSAVLSDIESCSIFQDSD